MLVAAVSRPISHIDAVAIADANSSTLEFKWPAAQPTIDAKCSEDVNGSALVLAEVIEQWRLRHPLRARGMRLSRSSAGAAAVAAG